MLEPEKVRAALEASGQLEAIAEISESWFEADPETERLASSFRGSTDQKATQILATILTSRRDEWAERVLRAALWLKQGSGGSERGWQELGCILINDSLGARKVIQGSQREPCMARYDLTDFEWKTIRPLLPNKPRGVPRVDDRRVLNGIFWVLRSGSPWADVPERYGPPTTIYNRFNRWRKAGVWDRLMDAIIAAHDGKVQMIDSTSVRVHQQAAAQKNRLEALVSVEVVED